MKRIAILISLVAGCGVDMADTSTDTEDLTSQEVEHVYFSDKTYTKEVGYTDLLCSGGKIVRGTTSRFYATDTFPCNGGGSHITCYEWPEGGDQNQVPCPVDIADYIVD